MFIEYFQQGGALTGNVGAIDLSSIAQPLKEATVNIPSKLTGVDISTGKGLFSSIGTLFNKLNLGSTLGTISNVASSLIPKNLNDKTFNAVMGGIGKAADAVMMINPLIGGIMKGAGVIFQGINALGSKKANAMSKDNEVASKVGSAYGGSMNAIDNAMLYQGTKYGLFNRKGLRKANRQIAEANRQLKIMRGITDEANDRFASQSAMSDMNNRAYAFSTQGGYQDMAVGKQGMKIFSKELIEHARKVISFTPIIKEETEVLWIDAFKSGGKVLQNVIPEGALHARLNHIETENITKKGIPVVILKEGGEVEQQAEIERNEIILNLDTTKKLEELMSKGDDEAAIEAGKLLAKEIMENTDDRTGLIKQVS